MSTRPWKAFAWCLLISAPCLPALAQFSIERFTIAGGGGTSTSHNFSVNSTLGQPVAGAMSSSNYSMSGGFWSVVTAIQTPDAPRLNVSRNSTNGAVTVSWPLPATDFVLDQSTTLDGAPIPWTQVNSPYQTNMTRVFITLPSPVNNRFYRLRKP
jgi:hypothetical protein